MQQNNNKKIQHKIYIVHLWMFCFEINIYDPFKSTVKVFLNKIPEYYKEMNFNRKK